MKRSPAEQCIQEALVYLENVDYGFVIFETSETEQQKWLAEQLAKHLGKKTKTLDFEKTAPEVSHRSEIKRAIELSPDVEALLILNFHTLSDSIECQPEELVRDLNLSRDIFVQTQKLFIFILPSDFVELMISGARDFWDFAMKFKLPPELSLA